MLWHVTEVKDAERIIRSIHPPIDLFEDIADPADWPLLISAEQKTNPRIVENIGNLDLVPEDRRVGGPGARYLMAPFTHISVDRPTRLGDSSFGVLYAGRQFETALLETIHHHGRFMARTDEAPGWTSQFREIVLDIDARLHDLQAGGEQYADALAADDYSASQALGAGLRSSGSGVSPIQAFAMRARNARGSSILTLPRMFSRVGISTIIGMESGSICTGTRVAERCSGSHRRVKSPTEPLDQ